MMSYSNSIIAAISFVIALIMVPGTGQSKEVAKGVTVDVIAEYPSKTSGVDKILFRKIVIKPGASWKTIVPAQSLCQATKGELEVVDRTSGKTTVFKVGDRWDTSPGHDVTLSNKGTVDHEHLLYTLIVKK
jgi:hypothetical protein